MAAERTVRIKFDGSAAGLATAAAKARAELKALEAQTEKNKAKFNDISAGAGKFTLGLGKLIGAVAGVSTVMNLIPTLAAGIATLAGVLPLAVAGGFAMAGVMATMKLGADGAKAAFANLTPTLDTMKASVSSSFEKSLTPAVNNLKVILPQLTGGFQQIATAIGGVAVKVTAMVRTSQSIAEIQLILGGTARVVQNLGAFLTPVIAAFLRIGAVAMPILVQLTAGVGAVGEKFNAFVQGAANSGALTAWIQNAIALFKQIFGVIKDVGSIVFTIFKDISDAGGGLGGVIGPVIAQVKDFVQSAQGHDTIVALATAINAVGTAVGQVLGAALKAVAPAMPGLVSAFSQFVVMLSPVFVSVIQGLGQALGVMAGFLERNMTWLGPILAVVLAVTLSLKFLIPVIEGVKAAIAAWEVVQAVLDAEMWANPIGVIILAILALIAIIVLIVMNLDFFRGVWDAVWRWCSDVITTVVNWFRNQWQSVWDWLTGLWNGITGFFSGVWGGVTDGVGRAVQWVRDRWSDAVEGVKGFFRGLGSFIGGIWDGITGGLKSAVNALIRFANMAINGVNQVTGVVGIPAIPNIPMLAKGGTAQAGRSYLVGERGPELFTPGQTGRVTSNEQTFGGPSVLEVHIEMGGEVVRVVRQEIDDSNRATRRAVTSMAGGTVR